MKLKTLIFVLTLSRLVAADASFQSGELKGSLGDIFTFGWDIQHPEDATLTFSELDMEGTGIEVLDKELTKVPGGSKLRFNTAIYDSVGIYTFPPLVVYLEDANGLDSLFLRGPALEITSVLTPSDTSFRDIKGIHEIRTPFNLLYLLLLILILAMSYLIYYLIRRIKKSKSTRTAQKIIVPPEEAHVIALRAFETLKRSKYIRFEQYKEFYSELTFILKQYYENRFLIDALEQTTSEFLSTLSTLGEFDANLIGDTQNILKKADFIKFAKGTSDELESGKALTMAIDLVNRTKIQINQGDNT